MLIRRVWVSVGWVVVLFLVLLTTGFGAFRMAEVLEKGWLNPAVDPDLFDRRYDEHPLLSVVHILPGLLVYWLGIWQFVPAIRSRFLSVHRWMGRIYLGGGLLAGGSALLLAVVLPAFRGWPTASATFVFGTLFLYCLVRAYRHVRRFEIDRHREWMIRGFGIALGVATIRVYLILWDVFTGGPVMIHFGTAFWLGLGTGAAAAESWVRLTRR